MTSPTDSPLGGDRLKKALLALSELIDQFPDKTRPQLLREIELKFDLSPLECEFLNKHFSSDKPF
jgi:hypothetical protein